MRKDIRKMQMCRKQTHAAQNTQTHSHWTPDTGPCTLWTLDYGLWTAGRRTKDTLGTPSCWATKGNERAEGGPKLTVAVMAFWATFDDFGHPRQHPNSKTAAQAATHRLLGCAILACVCVLLLCSCAFPPKSQNGGLKNRHPSPSPMPLPTAHCPLPIIIAVVISRKGRKTG